jgi:predicted transcriptional regulator
MTDVTHILAELGFSDYEARAYVALLRRHPINGYELAKSADVPRGNIYGVLQRLEARGAVVRVETPDGTRYDPLPPQEFLPRLASRFQSTLDAADQLLKQVASPRDASQVWSLGGYEVLLDHARSLIADAQEQLLLAVWPDESGALADDVAAAVDRGVAVRTLCLAGCAEECGSCRGDIHRYRLAPESAARWLVVIPDRAEVLAGEIRPGAEGERDDETTRAVRTRQSLLVDLTASYIRHSIALAAVLVDAGPDLGSLLSPNTREVLDMVGQEDGLEGWFRQISLDLA